MIKFLAIQVRLKVISINQVPEEYREAVELELGLS